MFFGGGGGVQEVLLCTHIHMVCLREYMQVVLNAMRCLLLSKYAAKCGLWKFVFVVEKKV